MDLKKCQIFTPIDTVRYMLDKVGYNKGIFGKKIIDNSCGNGSAMRISAIGFFANTEEEVELYSKSVTEVTHNHPEGIKGAYVTAMCIFMARKGASKKEIKAFVEKLV